MRVGRLGRFRYSVIGGTSLLAILALAATPALSGEKTGRLVLELGGGGAAAPRYEGASSYMLSPYPSIRLKKLNFGALDIGGSESGFFVKPSFRFVDRRDASDDASLTGLNAVSRSIELGLGAGYEWQSFRVFGDLRKGISGHKGWVGEAGADVILRPAEKWTVSAGPRLSFADSTYMNTYFGVTAAESAASGMPAFSAGGGVKSIGVEALVRYDANEHWAIEGGAGYARLIGDAANSPVTRAGSADQFTAKIGLIRKFDIQF